MCLTNIRLLSVNCSAVPFYFQSLNSSQEPKNYFLLLFLLPDEKQKQTNKKTTTGNRGPICAFDITYNTLDEIKFTDTKLLARNFTHGFFGFSCQVYTIEKKKKKLITQKTTENSGSQKYTRGSGSG